MNTVITVIVLVVMLGILISTHELGHLLVAKAFNVYCLEYAIGFGPKIFSWKTKRGETTYSLRAIPLGGFVSMYEDGVELPEGVEVPPERCLSGIKAWKKALVMVAGITVNLITCVLFTLIYTIAFPNYYQTEAIYTGYTDGTSNVVAYGLWADGTVDGVTVSGDSSVLYTPEIAVDSKDNQIGFVLDSKATFTHDGTTDTVVAIYLYQNIKANDLLSCTTFYYAKTDYTPTELDTKLGIYNKADTDRGVYKVTPGSKLSMSLEFLETSSKEDRPQFKEVRTAHTFEAEARANEDGSIAWTSEDSIKFSALKYWDSFGERVKDGFAMVGNYFVSIGLGLKAIFSFNFSQVGSVVAMGSVLSQSSAAVGWGRTFFVYGGFLGLNLAILNLLPFPGLDGWQLLVVLIEKIRGKKIPDKVKGIVSMIGIGLLLAFGIAIIIKDIIGLLL